MSSLRSSHYKRSAVGQIREREYESAKRCKHSPSSSSSTRSYSPAHSRSLRPSTSRCQDMDLLELYIKKAIQTVKNSLKSDLKLETYPQCVLKDIDIKIRQRINIAICNKVINSDSEILHLYSSVYNMSSNFELFRSALQEYNEAQKKLAMISKVNKSARLSDAKPLLYSDNLAKSLSNESILTAVKSLADEVMIQAAQRQIITELYEANKNIQHMPKNCIEELTETIRSTLDRLDRRASDWHWTKIYELYRKYCSLKSDERMLLEICNKHGFKIPTTTRLSENLYLDVKPPKPIISAAHIAVNNLKMALKTTCVDVNNFITFMFKYFITGLIKTIVLENYFTIKPSTRSNVSVLTYRQYRSVEDDIELFKQFENEMVERTRRDTSSKELISELHFWQNDKLTSSCFFEMVKITTSKIIGHILTQYEDASLYHINFLIYEIRSELMKLKYMRKANKWALTYSEILGEFQKYGETKLDFYISRYIIIKTNILDEDNTVEKKETANVFYNPKYEELRRRVQKMLTQKLDLIFDKGIKMFKGELKSENEDDVTTLMKEPTTESGTSRHEDNIKYKPVTLTMEGHAFQDEEYNKESETVNQVMGLNVKHESITHDNGVTEIVRQENAEDRLNNDTLSPFSSTRDVNEPSILNKETALNKPTNHTETEIQDDIVTNIKSEPVVDDEMEDDICLPMDEITSHINHQQITQENNNVAEIVKQENIECGMSDDTLLPFSSATDVNEPNSLNQATALNKPIDEETATQENIITNMKIEPILEEDEIETDIVLPISSETLNQVMGLKIKHEPITHDNDVTESVRQENVECGMNDDTLVPFSSARDVNEPGTLNQATTLNRPINQTETETQDNIVTNIKSEPMLKEDEIENDIVLPIASETVNQVIGLNIKHEPITHDNDVTESVRQENVECEMNNDALVPFSSAIDVNEPGILNQETALNKPTNQTETETQDNIVITNMKSESILDEGEIVNDIVSPKESETVNQVTRVTIMHEPITQDENVMTPTDTSTGDVKNIAVTNDTATFINQELSCSSKRTLGGKRTSRSPVVKVIHNIIEEHLSAVIPNLKKKLMSTMLSDNELLNNFDEQLPKTDCQLIRLSGEPRLPPIETLLKYLKQFNPQSVKLRKNINNTIFVETRDWSKLLEIGEVRIDGNNLLIEKENYCMKMVDIPPDPETINLIKTIDKWNMIDQTSQTYSRLVVRKPKPNGDECNVLMEKDKVVNMSAQQESKNSPIISDSTPVASTSNNTVNSNANKKKKKKKRFRKTKIYIENDEDEVLPSCAFGDDESMHEVATEDDFNKIMNDLDAELEGLLTTIKENENQPESGSIF